MVTHLERTVNQPAKLIQFGTSDHLEKAAQNLRCGGVVMISVGHNSRPRKKTSCIELLEWYDWPQYERAERMVIHCLIFQLITG